MCLSDENDNDDKQSVILLTGKSTMSLHEKNSDTSIYDQLDDDQNMQTEIYDTNATESQIVRKQQNGKV
jgi:hypothetical protein